VKLTDDIHEESIFEKAGGAICGPVISILSEQKGDLSWN
jgi:hypothetical protein